MRIQKATLVLVILSIVGLSIYLVLARPNIASLADYGYLGIFFIMFLSSSTVLFPFPGFATVIAAGALWSPLLVGICAGLGAATGELTGYLAGYGGKALLISRHSERWQQAEAWLRRYGFLALLFLAAIPNPFFDVIGIVAGSLSYPVGRFWLACGLGNSAKLIFLAYLGERAAIWLLQ